MTAEETDGCRIDSTYGTLGGRTRLASTLGADVTILRNQFGEVINLDQAGAAGEWSARIERDALGLEIDRLLPGGVRSKWTRDNLGRPTKQTTTVGDREHQSRSYEWGLDSRLKSLTLSGQGRFEFEHDAVGNLAAATYPNGRRDLRLPDAVGNLFRTELWRDREYGPAGQLLRSGSMVYSYDGDGNLIEKRNVATFAGWRYDWNAAGMLTTVHRPDGKTVTFTYELTLGPFTQRHRAAG